MTPENFCYWLQGFFEINNNKNGLTEQQALIIKDHLKLVFNKQTPNYPNKGYNPYPQYYPQYMQDIITEAYSASC